ncbi:DUF2523 family protein [Luteimonas panaciterrae]|uniref:DUF2523 family protein n=1 Tax=Luteimonas panaciterrae TaxID=363885 RepID=UPI001CFAC1E1|nr:DUF2523 family protein [Luteimonas panaciterrae]
MFDIITRAFNFFTTQFSTIGHIIVFRVLAALGIGLGTYMLALPIMVDFIQQYLNGLSDSVTGMLATLRIDKGLTMIFSAYGAKLGIRVRAIKLAANP